MIQSKNLLEQLFQSPTIKMSRCLLVYLAIASFQCHFLSTAGQSNGGDLMYPDEEPQSPPSSSSIGLLRGRTGDQIRNELAMAIAENANWDKMNVILYTKISFVFRI